MMMMMIKDTQYRQVGAATIEAVVILSCCRIVLAMYAVVRTYVASSVVV